MTHHVNKSAYMRSTTDENDFMRVSSARYENSQKISQRSPQRPIGWKRGGFGDTHSLNSDYAAGQPFQDKTAYSTNSPTKIQHQLKNVMCSDIALSDDFEVQIPPQPYGNPPAPVNKIETDFLPAKMRKVSPIG